MSSACARRSSANDGTSSSSSSPKSQPLPVAGSPAVSGSGAAGAGWAVCADTTAGATGAKAPEPAGASTASTAHDERRRGPQASRPSPRRGESRLDGSRSEGAISWRAIRRDPLRMVRAAADIVMVARDTASMSPPSLNGSRTSLLRNCAGNSARSIEKSPYGSR